MKKRKWLLSLLVIVGVLASFVMPTAAETASGVGIAVNNLVVSGNVPAIYSNGTTLVPAKEFAESLGGTFTSDRVTLTGTIRQGENELVFRLDDSIVKLNGKYIQAPASMKVINYRFMVPAEFVAKNLGAETYMNTNKNLLMVFQSLNGKIIYQAAAGDTLWIISQLFGTSTSTLKQLNGLTGDMIYVGQKIVIKNYSPVNSNISAKITQNATIRSGPGTTAGVVGYIQTGANISVTGKNGGWYKVITPKGNGYIYYSVVGINQDISDNAADSTYFNGEIPVDTSKDFVTYTTYTVAKGDSIWAISLKVGVPDYEIAQANNVSPYAILYNGQVLKVPVHNIPVKKTLGPQYGELLDWFKEARYVFPTGKVGKFTDVETGKSFMAKRTMGANHSDTETLTTQDSQTMKDIFGGSWTWDRRPFILEVDGRRIAISVAGMAHAGVDGVPFLQNVDNRSDNWGTGPNYDSIAGNGMDGHFDVYFVNCLRHVDNKIDPAHQYRVLLSGGMK